MNRKKYLRKCLSNSGANAENRNVIQGRQNSAIAVQKYETFQSNQNLLADSIVHGIGTFPPI
jgi:hypothetical protein